MMSDIRCRVEKASRAFRCLRGPIFNNFDISIPTKRTAYQEVVLAVLLYGSDTWVWKAQHIKSSMCFTTIV